MMRRNNCGSQTSGHNSNRKRFARAALAAAAVTTLQGVFASGASADTWDGGGSSANWSDNLNWVDDSAPVSPEALIFAGNTQLSNTNDNTADTLFNGIEFASGAGSFTLAGNSIKLGGDINQNSANAQTISLPIVLDGATVNVNRAGGGALSLGQVSFGVTPAVGVVSTAVNTLNINNSVSATSFAARANTGAQPAVSTLGIASGQTFTVNGEMSVGVGPAFTLAGGGVQTHVTATGGGSLVVNSGTNLFRVGLARPNTGAGGDPFSSLNLAALSNFTFTGSGAGHFRVGNGNSRGDMTLANTGAATNSITAPQVRIGDTGQEGGGTGGSDNNNGGDSVLRLGGGTNVFNTDSFIVGRTKGRGQVVFQGAGGSFSLAGLTGGASTANMIIGSADNGGGAGGVSELLLAGHSATVQAGDVLIGALQGNGTGAGGRGTITFDNGTFTINTLRMGINSSTGTTTNPGGGTLTIGGGTLTVNNQFTLASRTTSTGGNTGGATGTFNVNGGTANINADILDTSTTVSSNLANPNTTTINVAGGTLNMTGKNIGSFAKPITTVNLASGSLTNAARIAGRTITLGGATVSGTPVYVLPAGGALTSSGLTLASGHGIEGGDNATPATIGGDVTVNSGGYTDPGAGSTPGTLSFSNNLTLNNGSILNFDLSDNPAGGNDLINVGGNLTLSGTVNIATDAIGAGATAGQTYTLINYTGTLTGDETNFATGSGGTRKTFTVVDTAVTPNQIQVLVGGSNPLSLTYIGDDNNNWEVQGAGTNWDASGTPEDFFNQDSVTFNNTSTNLNAVQVVGTVQPSAITVDATRNYTFAGTGSIAGAGTLTKSGTGTLTVNTANTYSGGTTINDGVVVIGNGGSLGTGAITNNTTLRINRTDTSTLSNVVSGGGTVEHTGTGTTTFTAGKDYTGPTNITAGTVVVQDETSLGNTGGGAVTISSGATLDLSAGTAAQNIDFGPKQFNVGGTGVGGNGAIVNNAGLNQINALERVNLTADTLVATNGVGTTSGRIDFRRTVTDVDGIEDVALNGFTLTKTGGGQFSLVNLDVGPGNIVVNQGIFALEQSTNIPNTGGTITYNNGTTAQWFNNNEAVDQSRPMIFNGDVSTGNADNDPAHIDANMAINGTLNHVTLANQNATQTTLAGNLTGPGALTKSGGNVLILAGASNTYAGGTTVNAGTLTVNNGNGLSTGPVIVNNTNTGTASNTQVNLSTGGPTTIGSLSGTITTAGHTATIDNGGQALSVNQTSAGTYQGTIVGAGSLSKTGSATLTLSNFNTYTGGTNANAGTLEVKNMHAGNAVNVAAGATLRVLESNPGVSSGHPSGDNASVSRPSALSIAAGGTLDITNNDIIIDYSGTSPVAAYEALVASGYNVVGDWQGDGITSSIAANDGNYVVAIADNSALAAPFGTAQGGPLFAGVDVDLDTVLIKFTHRADINLDGLVTPDDSAAFGGNYDENQPATWATGDMNYDGIFTPDDAAIFGGAYDEALASLPEPASLSGLSVLGLGLMRRRVRARR